MKLEHAPPAQHGVDTLMYVGDAVGDTTTIDLPMVAAGGLALGWALGTKSKRSWLRTAAALAGAISVVRGVRKG